MVRSPPMPIGAGQNRSTRSGCRAAAARDLASVVEVHGHPRLAEDVLAGIEGGHGDFAVHVGRGADPDDVHVVPCR